MQDSLKSSSYQQLEQKSKYTNMFLRWFLYFILILFASYFIFPLYVMVVTSLKTMEEIRQGTLLSWPSGLNLESWAVAWGGRGYGAGLFTVYWRILLPMMRPVFFTSFVILVHISIKSYDLIVALTQGGPGISTTMPALYMTQTAFHKSQVGLSAASAMMMFMAVAAVIIPYLYSELRRENAR